MIGAKKVDNWSNTGGNQAVMTMTTAGKTMQRRSGKLITKRNESGVELRYHQWTYDEVKCFHVFPVEATVRFQIIVVRTENLNLIKFSNIIHA